MIRRAYRKLLAILRKTTIQIRMNLVFLILVFSLFLVTSITLNQYAQEMSIHRTNEFTKKYVEQLAMNMDVVLEQNASVIYSAATDIKLNNAVRGYAEKTQKDQLESDVVVRNSLNQLREAISNFCGAEICSTTNRIASLQTPITTGDINSSEILKEMDSFVGSVKFLGTRQLEKNYPTKMNNKYLLLSAPITSRVSGKTEGFLSVAISELVLHQIISKAEIPDCQYIYICSKDGRIISHPEKERIGFEEPFEIRDYIDRGSEENSQSSIEIDGQKYSIQYANSEVADWRVVAVIDYEALMSEALSSFKKAIAPIIGLLLITVLLSWLVSRSILDPLEKLMNRMRGIDLYSESIRNNENAQDEIVVLDKEFDNMTDRIHQLLTQNMEALEKKRQAEMRALYAQVSPHFLYNTLDTINWMAYMADNYDVCEMIGDLSDFFRLSLNFGEDIHTIEKEIKHVRCYCNIQEKRYTQIQFLFEIEDEALQYKTLKILLQPLVENAIQHGLAPKHFEGVITIRVFCDENNIHMEIVDDGVGILQTGNKIGEKHSGYGIRNINERIQLYYGNEYGVKAEKNVPEGTKMIISIPMEK